MFCNSKEKAICATISTEIGEFVEEIITISPEEDFGLEVRK